MSFGEDCLRLFECPKGINPLWFSTLCLYYYAHIHNKLGVGHHRYNKMIPVKTKKETIAIISHQNLSAVKNNAKTTTKISLKKIQVKAKTLKLDPENSTTKS